MSDRLILEATQSFQESAIFTAHGDGILISVSEEKAVDSYNQSFTCDHDTTREQAIQLRDWLLELYPIEPATEK